MLLQSSLKDLFALQRKKWKEEKQGESKWKDGERDKKREFCYAFVPLPKVLLPVLEKMKLFNALVTTPNIPP